MRRQFPRADRPFYEVKAAARAGGEPTATDLWIYDVIGDDWFDPSLTAKELCQAIAAVETDEIVLHLSSPGGSMSDGIAIYNALASHPASVRSVVEGWTGSIATVVALAADPGRVAMFDNTMWMVHHPWGVQVGNATAMRDYAEYLDRCSALMQRVYLGRVRRSEEELLAALDAETYFDAGEAAEWGFVDEVLTGRQEAAACDAGVLEALGLGPRRGEPLAVGRSLSADNEGKLRDAVSLLDEVLSTLDSRSAQPASACSGDARRSMDSKALAALRLASPRH